MLRPLTKSFVMLMAAALPATSVLAATPITECGTVVTDPGDYILTQDLFCEADLNAIHILSSDVTLDLGGHTVTCGASSADNRIGAVIVGDYVNPGLVLENVTVKNGTATACDDGVAVFFTRGTEVTRMHLSDNIESGLVLVGAADTLAHGIKVRGTGVDGIQSWYGVGNTFTGNMIGTNGNVGIWAYAETGSQFICNRASFNNVGIGLGGWSSENIVRGNIATFNLDSGLLLLANGELPDVVLEPVWNNLVEDNISLSNGGSDLVDVVWNSATTEFFVLPECANAWANNHFVSAIGSADCNFVPVPMKTVDVCGMPTGVLTPARR